MDANFPVTAINADPHLELDCGRKSATVGSRQITLTRKEFELLAVLVENAGHILPRETLLLSIWGYNKEIRTRTLDVHVRRLRKKLGQPKARCIETVFAVGYRFRADWDASAPRLAAPVFAAAA